MVLGSGSQAVESFIRSSLRTMHSLVWKIILALCLMTTVQAINLNEFCNAFINLNSSEKYSEADYSFFIQLYFLNCVSFVLVKAF